MKIPLPSRVLLILATLLLTLVRVRTVGANTIANYSWEQDPQVWDTLYSDVDLQRETTGGNPNGWLAVSFPVTANPEYEEAGWQDVVYINRENLFAGNWSSQMGVAFDFFASNAIPQDLQVQFASTNGNVWGFNVTSQVSATQTWSTVQVGLNYSAAWGPLPGFDDTEEQFLADLSAIDWIGVYFFRDQAGVENYGLDNFRLLVPEPGEWAMLGAVVVGAVWMRRRTHRDPQPVRVRT